MPGEYRLRVLSPEVADERYALRDEVTSALEGETVYIQSSGPEVNAGEKFLWIDTSQPGKATFWIEDGR